MRIIFLDIDGVLHPLNESDNPAGWLRWLPVLEALLVNAPDVKLVVHSTWRYSYTDAEMRELLGPLSGRFLGSAPRMPREQAIELVLQANKLYIVPGITTQRKTPPRKASRWLNVLMPSS